MVLILGVYAYGNCGHVRCIRVTVFTLVVSTQVDMLALNEGLMLSSLFVVCSYNTRCIMYFRICDLPVCVSTMCI